MGNLLCVRACNGKNGGYELIQQAHPACDKSSMDYIMERCNTGKWVSNDKLYDEFQLYKKNIQILQSHEQELDRLKQSKQQNETKIAENATGNYVNSAYNNVILCDKVKQLEIDIIRREKIISSLKNNNISVLTRWSKYTDSINKLIIDNDLCSRASISDFYTVSSMRRHIHSMLSKHYEVNYDYTPYVSYSEVITYFLKLNKVVNMLPYLSNIRQENDWPGPEIITAITKKLIADTMSKE